MGEIRRLREQSLLVGPFVHIFNDRVVFPSGSQGTHVRIEPAITGVGVVIVARHNHRIGLVRTFRYPLGSFQWALPRGFGHSADPIESARAELAEELGAEATSSEVIGYFTPDSGLQSTRVAVVRMDVIEPGTPTDLDEVDDVRWNTPDELTNMIRAGDLEDGMTLASLALCGIVAGSWI